MGIARPVAEVPGDRRQAKLRQQLLNVIAEEVTGLHEQKILHLAKQYPEAHLQPHPPTSHLVFNCVMFAFDLVDRVEPNVIQLDNKQIGFLVDSAFLQNTLDHGLLTEIEQGQAAPDDLLVYFAKGKPMHMAKYLTCSHCLSKWGIGLLCEHGLWDLPRSYGDLVRYYKPPDRNVLDGFLVEQIPTIKVLPRLALTALGNLTQPC